MAKKIKNILDFKVSLIMIIFLFSFFLKISNAWSSCSVEAKPNMNININDQATCMEERYGFDEDTMRSAGKKASVPEVRIFFSESNPDEGQDVTANATAMWFRNPPEDLHYTWYLIRAKEDGSPQAGSMKEENGPIHIAMKRVAAGAFNPDLFGIDYDALMSDSSYIEDGDGYNALVGGRSDPSVISVRGNAKKNWPGESFLKWGDEDDGYFANVKKGLVRSSVEPCFKRLVIDNLHGHRSGDYQAVNCGHFYVHANNQVTGDGDFFLEEEKFWGTDPFNRDTDGDGIPDEADVAGLNQTEFTWPYKAGDRVGVIVEGVSSRTVNYESARGGKYKIMWATPGICGQDSEGVNSIGDNLCDSGEDFGFYYMKGLAINESVDKPAEIEIKVSPKDPQFFSGEHSLSSWIEASGIPKEGDIYDKREIYYEWSVYKCDINDLASCFNTANEVTDSMDFATQKEGLGLSNIKFKPSAQVLGSQEEREVFFKVKAFTRRCKGDTKKAMAEANFIYTKNPMAIRVYKTKFESGKWSVLENEVICEGGVTAIICPVYPNQVVAVKAFLEDGFLTPEEENNKTFSWFADGKPVQIPVDSYSEDYSCNNIFPEGKGCFDDEVRDLIFFPMISGGGESELVLKAIASIGNPEVQTEESVVNLSRGIKFYIYNPFLNILNDQSAGSQALETDTLNNWTVNPGQLIIASVKSAESFSPLHTKVNWIYDEDQEKVISEDGNMELQWEVNGIVVSDQFADLLELYGIGTSYKDDPGLIILQAPLNSSQADGISIKARLKKTFPDIYIENMNEAWGAGIASQGDLVTQAGVNVLISLSSEAESWALIGGFLASTWQNYPRYLEMILKLSLMVMLLIFCLYFYFSRIDQEYEKNT